jgi:serine/threonine protein kinase
MAFTAGELINNRYRIVKLLGEGGFGAVYRAWDLSLKRPCALKENLDVTPEAQRQFEREATVLAQLNHTNLPRVTDHFVIPGQGQYLVMDFVEGMDLATLVQSQGAVMPAQAIPWILQIAGALEYLHSQPSPIIHRDIKPANIRIRPDGSAVLVDFGLVKVYDSRLRTTIGARAVTPGYAPPEQYGQGTTDPRTDIYALGATLYSLLTGTEPTESVQRMSGTPLPPVQQLNNQVSAPTGRIIERAMALQPNQRFQTVAEFKNALITTVSQPVQMQPISAGQPVGVQVSPLSPLSIATPLMNPPTGPSRSTSAGWLLWVLIPFALLGILAILAGGGYLVTIPMRPTPTARIVEVEVQVMITPTPDRAATQETSATETARSEELNNLRFQSTSQAQILATLDQSYYQQGLALNDAYNEITRLNSTLAASGNSGGPTATAENPCPGSPNLYEGEIFTSGFNAGDNPCLVFYASNGVTYNIIVAANFDSTMRLFDFVAMELQYSDDNGPGINPLIAFTASYSGYYYVMLDGFSDSSSGEFNMLIRTTAMDPIFNDNAIFIDRDALTRGWISESSWVDIPSYSYRVRGNMYYLPYATTGQTIQIDVFAAGSTSSQVDPVVELYDPFGSFLASNDDWNSLDSQLTVTLPYSGGYFILVRSLGDTYGTEATHFYDVLVSFFP